LVYLLTAVLQLAAVLGICLMIGLTYRIKYNKVLNPIIIFGPLLIAQWIVLRIGVIQGYFYPNLLQDSASGNIIRGYFTSGQYINVFGIVPEILMIGDIGIGLFLDLIYWVFLDKRRQLLINETSAASLG
jgi:hypothetical protein